MRDLAPFLQFIKRKKHQRGVIRLEAYNLVKINSPPWAFFMIFKLYKWY